MPLLRYSFSVLKIVSQLVQPVCYYSTVNYPRSVVLLRHQVGTKAVFIFEAFSQMTMDLGNIHDRASIVCLCNVPATGPSIVKPYM